MILSLLPNLLVHVIVVYFTSNMYISVYDMECLEFVREILIVVLSVIQVC
jgi:hypothetical protein